MKGIYDLQGRKVKGENYTSTVILSRAKDLKTRIAEKRFFVALRMTKQSFVIGEFCMVQTSETQPTNLARAETKLALVMPCKEEENEVSALLASFSASAAYFRARQIECFFLF